MDLHHPLLAPWPGPHGGLPPFDAVAVDDFAPGLELGMAAQLKEVDAIATAAAAPTFENTIAALERAGQPLGRAQAVFWLHVSSLSTPDVRKVEAAMAPKLAAFADRIVQNEKLFARIRAVYEARASLGLTPEQQRLTWATYTYFVKQGAALPADKKAQLAGVHQQLAESFTRFGQNVLHDEEADALVLTKREQLAGLPEGMVAEAQAEAARRGKPDAWAVANTRSAMEPFLTLASDRGAREAAFKLWTSRGDHGDAYDNNALCRRILELRAQKATLLGFESYAHWKLSDSMAKTPQAALSLVTQVWEAAKRQLGQDLAACQALAKSEGATFTLEPWDYRYYAEKLRRARYDFDSAALTPYLQLEHVREAMFFVAEKLYGLHFTLLADASTFHPEVRVYRVLKNHHHVGTWYFDPYARHGKQSGAWMSAYRDQHRLDGDVPTVVSNNSNFMLGAPGQPVTISWDDARTMFHEFGHALHGLCSNVTYPSLSGTNTLRDFVELPSQFHEHYLSTKEVLHFFVDAHGQRIPQALVDKLEAAKTFNAAFATAEAQLAALADLKLHLLPQPPTDLRAFERGLLEELGVPRALVMRHRLPHFGHVFSSEGYAAGYYSYLWAEVLEHDAFEAFTEGKGAFDEAVAKRFHDCVLSVGNTVDPADAFKAFRGRGPKVDALLRAKGF